MLQNDIFLRAVRGEQVERPPVWLMRQAGRILPEYRAIRKDVANFKALVKNPDLCAEVTCQPIDALDVDAAILFSDILVIPEAMGLDYELVEKKGPIFPTRITSPSQIDELLSGDQAAQKLEYVYEAIQKTKNQLDNRVPLIGFTGAPWTLFAYMIEGSGSKTFAQAKKMLYQDPKNSHKLLQKITDTIISYLQKKIENGVHLVQIFDSWAGLLDANTYSTFCIPYINQICRAIQEVPKTVFAKGAWFSLKELNELDCQVIGLDWNIDPLFARQILGTNRICQGNLDPCQLYGSQEDIKQKTESMIKAFGGNHIVNLGHGVYPDTPLDGVKAFVNSVKNYRY